MSELSDTLRFHCILQGGCMCCVWLLLLGCSKGEANGPLDDSRSHVQTVIIPTDNFEKNGLKSDVFELALKAFGKARSNGLTSKTIYTIVDFRMHSKEKRLWTVDLATGELLFNEVTTHGRHSDLDHNGYLETISNTPESKQTSVGLYQTAEVYMGEHGRSLRLDGLEKGFNDNARDRAIVIHGADYAGDYFVQKHGKAGRSFGCPAVSNEVSDKLISTIKDGSLVFVYVEDEEWLKESEFLH